MDNAITFKQTKKKKKKKMKKEKKRKKGAWRRQKLTQWSNPVNACHMTQELCSKVCAQQMQESSGQLKVKASALAPRRMEHMHSSSFLSIPHSPRKTPAALLAQKDDLVTAVAI